MAQTLTQALDEVMTGSGRGYIELRAHRLIRAEWDRWSQPAPILAGLLPKLTLAVMSQLILHRQARLNRWYALLHRQPTQQQCPRLRAGSGDDAAG